MSVYGISWIKLDSTGTEVEEAKVHEYSLHDPIDTTPGLDVGKAMTHHEIANLIVGGDEVYVIVWDDDAGVYQHTDKVRVKPGQREYLESFGADGTATTALMSLPTYQ
ncbi:hypothetical protein M0D68_06850 [Paraburkholderia sp. SEWSISQ10-3 4]|uniref:hypothetical protein n=1 Tax=Paraburkholderia TaxID=1822464 RepID=UPI00225BD60C|nr:MULTISPECIES: hypothetical protein [Paraburkholderia]MCX4137895.1 hypothetical protein [Paraburkholderia aspalathi]MDN7170586.1 hypothetical protein [Paraburkholderia sp. SEWSISQ10-3 4]MDQ6500225.1 hypothetical protein [Paraburkholderia aspalathi]